MRLHRLGVQAFGPFGGREEVDFDALHDAGLFLLSGPTGAGKTSLLDAVCFALYGQVPGVRDERTLRSQHAEPGLAPVVELELTVRGRRLRLRRTAEWERPKRRGEGTTVERASVSLSELRGSEEHHLSSRAQEVGHEIGLLLGMTAGQFQQVAMLPQGRFQQFLLADSEERQAVLTKLFGTQRFGAIEEWIADHCRTIARRAGELRAEAEVRLHSLADRAGVAPPAVSAGGQTADETATTWRDWASEVCAALGDDHTRSTAAVDQARARLAEARHTREQAETWTSWWSRRQAAAARAQEAAAAEDALEEARRRLSAHVAAQALRPLLDDHALTSAELATALAAAGAPASELASQLTVAEKECEALTSRVSVLDAAVPVAAEIETTEQRAAEATTGLADLRAELADVEDECEALPALVADAERAVRDAEHAAAEVPRLTEAVTAAEHVAAAARSVPDRHAAHDAAGEQVRRAQEADLAALDHLRAVVEARLQGMAAELASALTDDEPCAVCGSTTHPDPALPAPDAHVGADDHAAADEARERTSATLARVREVYDETAAALTAARLAAGGLTPEAAGEALELARRELASVEAARVSLPDLRAEADRVAARLATSRARRAELATQIEQQRDVAARAAAAAAEARARLHSLLQGAADGNPDSDHDGGLVDLAGALRAEQQRAGDALARLRVRIDALRSAQGAVTAHQRAAALLVDPLAEAGFADADAARVALLADDQVRDLRRRVQEVADAAAEAAAVLREPPPDDVAAPDPGDAATATLRLTEARHALVAAEEAAQQAERAHATAADRWQAAQQLAARLDDAITAWLPAAAEHQHADGLSRLVRGTSADNRLQMRLSAYVLATRLDQVVDAANVRLARMRDRRFLLRRTDRAASRRTRAGLDLEVLDQWTGVARAPSSLSGGETFVVSLTLALGLADVIAQETGGVELETLFIDEGFGMLDADTLDDVLDRLDELRAGGRSVGVVSHVSEMRARIPVQVRVEKTRSGSRVMSPHDLDRSRTPH